jgi:hypothetical protein
VEYIVSIHFFKVILYIKEGPYFDEIALSHIALDLDKK